MVSLVFDTLIYLSTTLEVGETCRRRQVKMFEIYTAVSQRRADPRPLQGPALSDELEAFAP
ncbi:hypothetical protein NA56DRAFT_645023 [Hyaloscypha hepaticicola]|uniref:Uncharacterized protein n=1 Tax=Hyaloscypha hepaticicola TaxID=2082293 RepID=A0A2J6Q7V2_9HELO|nr:hypothetical protein NA56DRAFT_645023 [Hyaloscypha hepaticicola]